MSGRTILLLTCLLIVVCAATPASASSAEAPQYEIESLFPMFFYGGAHLAVGMRLGDVRLRASCIDGGDYDYEPNNEHFERNLGTGCGLFAGYFFSGNWHAYLYVEKQSYIVTNRDNGVSEEFAVTDIGPGIGYQYFMTKNLYLQPALHLYWRPSQTKTVGGRSYTLRETDISPTIRLGYRF